jgi:hypothetical protein
VWPLQNAVTGRGAARRIDHPSIEVAPNRNTSPASIDAESTAARAQRPRAERSCVVEAHASDGWAVAPTHHAYIIGQRCQNWLPRTPAARLATLSF